MSEASRGRMTWRRRATPYEQFMEEQGIPIHRGMAGVPDTKNLTRGPWKRMGGQGAFIDLDGTGGLVGIYIVEVPGGGALNPERHLYEEVFHVLVGRGTTEIWTDDNPKRQSFEWQTGSLFTAPLNTWHQVVNAASSPALLLVETNAPPVMQIFRSQDFIFNTPHHFSDRYDLSDDYFKPWDEIGVEPSSGRSLNAGALIPDIVHCELPYDGQRAPGYRFFFVGFMGGVATPFGSQPGMAGNTSSGFVSQYPSGRYSKLHAHEPGAVLACLTGKGYLLTWPKSAGMRPWEVGNDHLVKRVDYGPGGIVSAAPGGFEWFHGHFPTSKEPYRVMAYLGGFPGQVSGKPGDEIIFMNEDIKKGGNTIEYRDEDPMVRKIYQEALVREGVEINMPDEFYK